MQQIVYSTHVRGLLCSGPANDCKLLADTLVNSQMNLGAFQLSVGKRVSQEKEVISRYKGTLYHKPLT